MKTAIVNGYEIPASAVDFELDRLVKFYATNGMGADEIKRNLPKLREKALEQAIGARLLMERAAGLDIPVAAGEIDAEVAKVVAQIGGEDNFRQALARQHLAEADFRREIEKGVRVNRLVNQACAHVEEPTEAEIEAFWNAHKDEYVEPRQVLCQHILVKSGEHDGQAAKDAALEKIRQIRARVVAGGDFAEEARRHSDCPSGAQGGSLGWFGRGMMVKEFDEAAFALGKGQVSDVVTTCFGYHIIYKADEKGGQPQTLVDVHDRIRELLRHQARGRATEAYVAELRAAAKIEYRDACECGHDHAHGHCDCGGH